MKNFLKTILVSFVIIVLFFGIPELTQRIRYAVRYKDPTWLMYGTKTALELRDTTIQEKERAEAVKAHLNTKILTSNVDGVKVFKFVYDNKNDYRKNVPGDYLLNENAGMHINSLGFRGPELLDPKTKTRLFMMGGSSTLGADNNDDNTYPYLTRKLLKEVYGKDIEVVNAGVGGMNIREIYYFLKNEIFDLKPDIITVYSGYNNWNAKSYEGTGLRSQLFKIKMFLLSKSLLLCTLNEKIYLMKGKRVDAVWYNPGCAEKILNDKKVWGDFELYLEKVCEEATAHKIRLILITQPLYLTSVNPKTFWEDERLWKKHYEISNDLIRNTAKRYSLECIDAADTVDRYPREDKDRMFVDVVHLTDYGNSVIAEIIAQKLNSAL
ncbi:MAG: SGNH/GDSL hydrolase family protein [Candidatus Omnitrophota bacterium]|jgi:lysophospholipase L1-like esterase